VQLNKLVPVLCSAYLLTPTGAGALTACPVEPLGIIKKIINNNKSVYCCKPTADLLATCAHKASVEPWEITLSVTSLGCSAPTGCQITLTSRQVMANYCKEMQSGSYCLQ